MNDVNGQITAIWRDVLQQAAGGEVVPKLDLQLFTFRYVQEVGVEVWGEMRVQQHATCYTLHLHRESVCVEVEAPYEYLRDALVPYLRGRGISVNVLFHVRIDVEGRIQVRKANPKSARISARIPAIPFVLHPLSKALRAAIKEETQL